jgi:hypothetical protein
LQFLGGQFCKIESQWRANNLQNAQRPGLGTYRYVIALDWNLKHKRVKGNVVQIYLWWALYYDVKVVNDTKPDCYDRLIQNLIVMIDWYKTWLLWSTDTKPDCYDRLIQNLIVMINWYKTWLLWSTDTKPDCYDRLIQNLIVMIDWYKTWLLWSTDTKPDRLWNITLQWNLSKQNLLGISTFVLGINSCLLYTGWIN